jgi:hypothetical protein
MPSQRRAISAAKALLVLGGLLTATAATAREPVWPAPGWRAAAPAAAQMDAATLTALADCVGGRGCVVRHGALVYTWGDIATPGDVASAAKPWYCTFILKAVEDGRIKGLDTPVADWEPRLRELNPDLGHKDARITWRHMASQTSCYGVTDEPGMAFDYNDWHMALLWDTLFLKVYGSSWDRVDAEVLHPLLSDVLQCQDGPTLMAFGTDDRPGRLAVSPRDFARLGLMYLRGGKWQDRQVLSPESVALATRSLLPNSIPQTQGREAGMTPGQRSIGSLSVPDNQCDHLGSYSFLWWGNGVDRDGRRHWPEVPDDAYGAFGHGGPRAMVIVPSLDVIVSWNDANITSREAENHALGLLTRACVDADPMLGQVMPDPARPGVLIRRGEGSYFMCGPGDPEGFLYRGTLREDGTRDGDQMELIRTLGATGANCLYLQAVRSHGGDGDATQNPFVGHDSARGLSAAVLDQWETWFSAMDEAGICIYLFIYDDSASIWDTGDQVDPAERAFLEGIVGRFRHHRNLIYCVAEEYQERFTPARVSAIAKVIRDADGYGHPVAVHKLDGLDFSEFADDPWVDQFAVQYNAPTAGALHAGMVQAVRQARGRYSVNLSECAGMGTGAGLRRRAWAAAMAGAHVMALGMDVASTPPDDLYACGRLARFMEATNAGVMQPADELATAGTEYVLADAPRAWLAYTSRPGGHLGLRDLPAGRYVIRWLDCATGAETWEYGVRLAGGTQVLARPDGLGDEVAVSLRCMP